MSVRGQQETYALQQFDLAHSIFCPLLTRQLNKHQPAWPRHARVGGYHLLIVHVTGDVGRSRQRILVVTASRTWASVDKSRWDLRAAKSGCAKMRPRASTT